MHWLRVVLGSYPQTLAEKQNHLEGLLKPGLFMVWEVQVELEKCFSNTFPGNADAGGLGTGLGSTGDGKHV